MKAAPQAAEASVPLTGLHKTQLTIIATAELVLGLGMLVMVFVWVYSPGVLTALDELFALFKPSLRGGGTRTLFQAQVLLLLGSLMLVGSLGLFLRRAWAWLAAQSAALTVLLLSIQVIYILASQGSPGASDGYLLFLMVFQGLQIGVLALLFQKEFRAALRVSVIDMVVALLFACILALDWNVTLYMLRMPTV
jgi:hypothetical protein